MRTRARTTTVLSAMLLLAATACGSGEEPAEEGGGSLTVWTLENLPDRLAAQQSLAQRFSEQTGIAVELVGIDEDQFSQLITSSAAGGDLPDVVGALSLTGVRSLAADELLDPDTAGRVVEELGADTFSPRALELTRDGDTQLAVPSDGWAQLLLYRKDLFAAAGLPEPKTFADVTAAAQRLNTDGVAGFLGGTAAGSAFTQQTFEHLALADGCEMVDDGGEVTLDSPQCVDALSFYNDLIRNSSVPGAQDEDTTRAAYFAGQGAMLVWSSFILDELAGLRADAAPSCPECAADPRFLVDNTGVVTALTGPQGTEPAQYGEVVSWAVLADADTDPAGQFVRFMMSDGYQDWLGFAPEGKFPTRTGTADSPNQYVDAWRALPAGVDTKAPLSQFYPAEVLDTLGTSVDTFRRWGITQGQGDLIGATLGELPLPQAIAAMTSGATDPAAAAAQADADVTEIQDSLR
ncbi:ABC transporter substrate-binding protein [Pseudonocardia humida]|uniref:Extracellular solute-binding protein n=1 Tax=Pseudonocardia humida TaxID=2800819 RepID=A0ABT1AAM0_9PSEU|nr:extracellular solute-binding protein [Pseudonocardia humida]MCO1660085.1 extracellular solute-binding protein [Pseudonocardia humida]